MGYEFMLLVTKIEYNNEEKIRKNEDFSNFVTNSINS